MSTFGHFREGISRAWDGIAEGWREFRERAGDAITRFYPATSPDEIESRQEHMARSGSRWSVLAAEVSDDDDVVTVNLEVPGMSANDFDVRVDNDVLVVSGEKRVSREERRGQYHVMQRAYGRFQRAIRLPAAVDDANAKATYTDGVLKLLLPKAQSSRRRRVIVQ